jgi:hypothetical protein
MLPSLQNRPLSSCASFPELLRSYKKSVSQELCETPTERAALRNTLF